MENLSVVVGSGVEMDLQCSMLKRFRILSMYQDCESDICPSLVFLFTSIPRQKVMGPRSVIGKIDFSYCLQKTLIR